MEKVPIQLSKDELLNSVQNLNPALCWIFFLTRSRKLKIHVEIFKVISHIWRLT